MSIESNMYSEKKPSSRVKLSLFLAQNGLCFYCETNMMLIKGNQITLDHIIPRVKGGGNNKDNKCMSCYTCNQLKSSYPPEEFIEWIKKHKKTIQEYNLTFNYK